MRAQENWPAERKERAKKAGEERMAYAASKDYDPYGSGNRDAERKANELLEKKDIDGALKVIDAALEKYKCDIDLWMLKAAALREKGDIQKADEARLRWNTLADSILLSGDGLSFDTAFKVISSSEQHVLVSVMGLTLEEQWLVANKSSMFDQRFVKDARTGRQMTLYFNIDIQWAHLQKTLFSGTKK